MRLKYIGMVLVTALAAHQGLALAAERLQPSDLTYLGAFRVPSTSFFESMGELGYPQTSGMTFHPNGNGGAGSIFIMGRGGRIAEITIPEPKMSGLNIASVLQSINGISGYGASLENDAVSGIAYMTARGSQTSPKLYFGSFEYYNVDATDYNSLGWINTNLSNLQTAGLWHVGPRASGNLAAWNHGVKHGEYLIAIPQAWADQYTSGRSLLVGRMREAAGAGGSSGPVLIATAPWASGNPPASGTELPATPLMYFYTNVVMPLGSSTNWQAWRMFNDPNWTYWNPGDRSTGGAWIERGGKRALVLGMRRGLFSNDPVRPKYGTDGSHGGFVDDPTGRTPPYCYGGPAECSNAVTPYKGYHTGPHAARLAFIDISDLEAVATGTKDPRTVTAYNVYNLMNNFGQPAGTVKDRSNSHDVVGVAYDNSTGKLYVGQSNGYDPNGHPNPAYPVIHVYQVSSSGSTPPAVTQPLNLRVVE